MKKQKQVIYKKKCILHCKNHALAEKKTECMKCKVLNASNKYSFFSASVSKPVQPTIEQAKTVKIPVTKKTKTVNKANKKVVDAKKQAIEKKVTKITKAKQVDKSIETQVSDGINREGFKPFLKLVDSFIAQHEQKKYETFRSPFCSFSIKVIKDGSIKECKGISLNVITKEIRIEESVLSTYKTSSIRYWLFNLFIRSSFGYLEESSFSKCDIETIDLLSDNGKLLCSVIDYNVPFFIEFAKFLKSNVTQYNLKRIENVAKYLQMENKPKVKEAINQYKEALSMQYLKKDFAIEGVKPITENQQVKNTETMENKKQKPRKEIKGSSKQIMNEISRQTASEIKQKFVDEAKKELEKTIKEKYGVESISNPLLNAIANIAYDHSKELKAIIEKANEVEAKQKEEAESNAKEFFESVEKDVEKFALKMSCKQQVSDKTITQLMNENEELTKEYHSEYNELIDDYNRLLKKHKKLKKKYKEIKQN